MASSVSKWQIHRCLFNLESRKKLKVAKSVQKGGESAVQICIHAESALSLAVCVIVIMVEDSKQQLFWVFFNNGISGFGVSWSSSHQ
jgi:pheromone shutdown protein TraB